VSPVTDAATQTRSPLNTPSATRLALRRPRSTAFFMTSTTAGPGMATGTAIRPMKAGSLASMSAG
jgi:hypothetical protein